MLDTFETLRTLTQTHGVSGNEGDVRSLIRTLAEPYADEITEDVMGNLIVHKKGTGPKVLFAAHMDSIGLVATHIDEDGFVRFATLGGFSVPDLLQQTFQFQNGTYAVCCAREEKLDKATRQDLYLDIGAKSDTEAKKMISIGDTAAYATPLKRMGESRVCGCYLDNRTGCLALLQALQGIQNPQNDLYFVFTVQEEVGLRGSKPASYGINPDYGIAVDVTVTDDVPGSLHEGTAALGKGSAIKIMDRSVICSASLVQTLNTLARNHSIPVQQDIITCGGTDAGAIRITRSGVVTGGISIPCRYTHSSMEQCDLGDLSACVALICAFCETRQASV